MEKLQVRCGTKLDYIADTDFSLSTSPNSKKMTIYFDITAFFGK